MRWLTHRARSAARTVGLRPAQWIVLGVALLAMLPAAHAAATITWSKEGMGFRSGTFEGLALAPNGALVPGVPSTVLDRPNVAVLWDLVADGDDVYAAGGENAGLWRQTANGTPEAIALPNGEVEIFALARAGAGQIYLATGPRGAVYRFDAKTKALTEVYRPTATYIWDLALLPGGDLAVATGLPGRVVRLDPRKKGGDARPIWETNEPHVRCLVADATGRLFAGTSGRGLVVQLDGQGKGFVLWDADRPEVSALAIDGRGNVWAALAGAVTRGEGARDRAREGGETKGGVEITVRGGGAETKDSTADADKSSPPARPQDLPTNGGALLKLAPGEEPDLVWSDDKSTPLALIGRDEGGVLLGTATPARVWWLDVDGRAGWWDERRDVRAISALARRDGRILAATSNPSSIVLYGAGATTTARWMSEVVDTRTRSRLGRVLAIPTDAKAPPMNVFVRTGNTSEPGPGWTDWSAVAGAIGPPGSPGGLSDQPRARYFQIRVEAAGPSAAGTSGGRAAGDAKPDGSTAGLSRIEVRYRPANRPPQVDSVDVQPPGIAYRALPPSPVASGEQPVVPPPRGADAERALGDAGAAQWRSKKAYEPNALTVTWVAQDLDGDALRYQLDWCRETGAPCEDWHLLASNLETNFYSFDGRWLPDGVYRFRVTARDDAANAVSDGREGREISQPVLVDHVPPTIDRATFKRGSAGQLEVRIDAHDAGGRLVRGEVSREPGVWRTLAPEDGVDDGASEVYAGSIAAPADGRPPEVRVTDAAGNATTAFATPQ